MKQVASLTQQRHVFEQTLGDIKEQGGARLVAVHGITESEMT